MTNINFRLELNEAATKDLITMLVESLAQTRADGQRQAFGLVLYEDETRKGKRNGHGLRIYADRQSASVFTTAYDLVVDGE